MKKVKIKGIITVLMLLIAVTTKGQQYYTSFTYNMSLPTGETADFISAYSWRGFGFEGHGFLSDNITLGGSVGWNVFYEKLSGEFVDETRTVTGTQLRYLNSFPLLFEGRYHFGEDYSTRPYIGAGVGTYYTEQETQMGIWYVEDQAWQFGFAPVVGVLIPVESTAINISIKYNAALSTSEVDGRSYLGINIGLGWLN